MHPATISAILQLDYDDTLPHGHPDEPAHQRVTWGTLGAKHRPLLRIWLLRLHMACKG